MKNIDERGRNLMCELSLLAEVQLKACRTIWIFESFQYYPQKVKNIDERGRNLMCELSLLAEVQLKACRTIWIFESFQYYPQFYYYSKVQSL